MTVSDAGLITLRSGFSVAATIDRLTGAVTSRGMTVFAMIDHAANAVEVGMELRPTQLLIFGNPRAGTLLMRDQQSVGLDLPLRTLVWEDEAGDVWATYDDPHWLATRYALGQTSGGAVDAMAAALSVVLAEATSGG
ncbi:MAG: DUF302 domain-containing protein [Pseudonocardia sp.]|nr:DUF302 domain-containing protein [Pseudonocardia sp.]